jgi:hypothetical protein
LNDKIAPAIAPKVHIEISRTVLYEKKNIKLYKVTPMKKPPIAPMIAAPTLSIF